MSVRAAPSKEKTQQGLWWASAIGDRFYAALFSTHAKREWWQKESFGSTTSEGLVVRHQWGSSGSSDAVWSLHNMGQTASSSLAYDFQPSWIMPFLVHNIMHTAWVCRCFWFRLKMSQQLRAVRRDQHGLHLFFNLVCSKWISCAENMKPAPFFCFSILLQWNPLPTGSAVLFLPFLGGSFCSFSSHCGLM